MIKRQGVVMQTIQVQLRNVTLVTWISKSISGDKCPFNICPGDIYHFSCNNQAFVDPQPE